MRTRLQTRILVPLCCLFLVSHVLVTIFSIRSVARLVDTQMSDALRNIVTMLSQSGFPLNSVSLVRMKEVVGYDLVVTGIDGQIVYSTLPESSAKPFQSWLDRDHPAGSRRDVFEQRGTKLLVAGCPIQRPTGQTGTTLHVLHPHGQVTAAKWRAAIPVASIAGLSLIVLTMLGYLLARTVSSPIRKLSREAQAVGEEGLERSVTVSSSDEVGELAMAFNQMLVNLRDSQEKLVESARLASLGQLAASLAHEIRNPLSSLRMTAQLLEKRLADDPSSSEPLRVIREEIDRLDFAVSEVLTFAKPRPPKRAPLRLAEVLFSLDQLMSRQLKHSHIESLREYDVASPLLVSGDESQLRQLVMNLMLNAMQAMQGGGRLALRMKENGDDTVLLEVEDSGHGISKENRSRIFEPFFSSREGGAGLGLVVCRRIAEQHEGDMGFETSGSGTCFWVELPIVQHLGRDGRGARHEAIGVT